MIERKRHLEIVHKALRRSPVVAILGPRQCGKTTLAKEVLKTYSKSVYLDLESPAAIRSLQNPELFLSSLEGLVVIDEIQLMPELFKILRVLVDRKDIKSSFLILGSASPQLIKNSSETLAGRVEFVDLAGFDLNEIDSAQWRKLWIRGGFPRAYLARADQDSYAWRDGFIRTFLQRDIPQLGIKIPAAAINRFWIMLAHFHGQVWNASHIASSMGISDKTVRAYLDLLTDTYMIRQLQPWHENIAKRQVKAPKIYFRDTGLLHNLLSIENGSGLMTHPRCGASWEGFALEQVAQQIGTPDIFYWATHNQAEIDLFFVKNGKRYGVEFKFSELPKQTKSMLSAKDSLGLTKIFIVYPGTGSFSISKDIEVCALADIKKYF
ncbi:MAG: ATP-binding protein [Candidatus Omnitrophica bacterium]|nr:ATP-binding protein [Candidatus Omnitrophota bacterium]